MQFEVIRPFDGSVYGTIPATPAAEVPAAIARARQAQVAWADVPPSERAQVFTRLARLVFAERDRILDVIQAETGKSRLSAFEEVMDAGRGVRVFASRSPRLLRPVRRGGAIPLLTRTFEHHRPVGVVGIINPWNYPFNLPATDSAQALLAGNAVIFKPDSQTPFTALLLAELLEAAGLPDGLFQVLPGSGAELGPAMVAGVDHLMFTGSTSVGRQLAVACAERLIGFSGELGGKNPLLVLADANVPAAVAGTVRAAFANTGQVCVGIERAYVVGEVYDEFVAQLVRSTVGLRLGAGYDWQTDVGSLASAKQFAAVTAHVEDAIAKGATVLAGGRARPDLGPLMYEPTILTDVTEEMTLCREETFGPVLALYRVESEEAAIRAANDTRYGLNASIWSAHGEAIAGRIKAGTVNINEGFAATWGSHAAPMGGMGESGMGRRHGSHGLFKYTEPQTVSRQRLHPIAPPQNVGNETYANVMTTAIRLLNRLGG
ncbi:MAG TPA: succinic semialdehyde dehydrogenase [Propionicimonas sp.]|nr:succinic semialdehyde dehydrogenase [Propionicimonas sp.]HQA78301.1 succinic semialdehyde dehydrogenase [Propionicimonas sp.]HQD96933.1 succinic semialdehyde dehydrogenase [Propionicimonas sp.]